MKASELDREQLLQLKAEYYNNRHPEGVSFGELANIDELVTDAEVIETYGGIEFTEEDFFGRGDT